MTSNGGQGRIPALLITLIKVLAVSLLLLTALELTLRTNLIRLNYGGTKEADFKTFSFNYEISLDRDLLYRIMPSKTMGINNYGYRDRDFQIKRNGKKRVLVLGDSFVMGLNVAANNTIAKVLEKSLGSGYEVYNMGVHGYGPDQSLVQLREDALRFHPDTVILGINPSNDYNDLLRNRVFSLGPDGELVRNRHNIVTEEIPDLDIAYLLRYLRYKYTGMDKGLERVFKSLFYDLYDTDFVINNDSQDSRLKAALMHGVIRDFGTELNKRGIKLLVVIIPLFAAIQDQAYLDNLSIGPEKYFLGEDMVAGMCREENIPYLNLHEIFRQNRGELIYDPKDTHFSVYGNWLTASIIHSYIVSSSH